MSAARRMSRSKAVDIGPRAYHVSRARQENKKGHPLSGAPSHLPREERGLMLRAAVKTGQRVNLEVAGEVTLDHVDHRAALVGRGVNRDAIVVTAVAIHELLVAMQTEAIGRAVSIAFLARLTGVVDVHFESVQRLADGDVLRHEGREILRGVEQTHAPEVELVRRRVTRRVAEAVIHALDPVDLGAVRRAVRAAVEPEVAVRAV